MTWILKYFFSSSYFMKNQKTLPTLDQSSKMRCLITLCFILSIIPFQTLSLTLPKSNDDKNVTKYNEQLGKRQMISFTELNLLKRSNHTKSKTHHSKKIKIKSKHHKKPKTKNTKFKTIRPKTQQPNSTNGTQQPTPFNSPPMTFPPPPSSSPLPNPSTSNNQTSKPISGNDVPPPNPTNNSKNGDSKPPNMPSVGELKTMKYGYDLSGKLFAGVWDSHQGGTSQAIGDDDGTFKVTWKGVDDIVIGKGWRTGTYDRIVNFNGTFTVNGNGAYLSLYGWSIDNCVEYYICENYGLYQPCGPTTAPKGTFESDGDSYTICEIPRSTQCIDGSKGFNQFWSVRHSKRSSGTIHFGNHVQAWKKFGMNLGKLSFPQQISVEAFAGSSGSAEITVEGGGNVN